MSTSLPEGFEGYILTEEQPQNQHYVPAGFEGIVLGKGTPFETRLALSFEGIVLTFSDQAVFFTVVNGLGRPIEGLKITAENTSDTREGFTTEEGKCILELSDTATITLQKDKAFKTISYDRSIQGSNMEVVFQIPMME